MLSQEAIAFELTTSQEKRRVNSSARDMTGGRTFELGSPEDHINAARRLR
jgi:hypothetical protein